MRSEWKNTELGEVVKIQTGRLDSNYADKDGIYPFFTCAPKPMKINKYAFDCNAILLAGNNANGIFHINRYNGKFNAYQRTYVITTKRPDLVNISFIYYALHTLTNRLGNYSQGTATKFLTMKILLPFNIPLPPLPEQRAIAHILSSLDDKIELNRRMNQTLEAMAQAIFKSWFVDFLPVRAKQRTRTQTGDPVWENMKRKGAETQGRKEEKNSSFASSRPRVPALPSEILDLFPNSFEPACRDTGAGGPSELGLIPKGWKVKRLNDCIEIHDSKRIPLNSRQRLERQGIYPYYGASGIMDYIDDYLFDGIYVLVGEDGTVIDECDHPIIQYVWGQFWVNNHAHILSGSNGISNEHLYLILRNINIKPYITGAVQPKVSQTNLKSIPVIIADDDINQYFNEWIESIFEMISMNTDEIKDLTTIRDTLLPKLISGELRVPDAENFVEEARI